MQAFVAALVFAALVVSAASAQQTRRQPSAQSWVPPGPARVDAQGRFSDGRVHSSNPALDVYDSSGVYAGSDPDPHVREMLRRDNPFNPRDSR